MAIPLLAKLRGLFVQTVAGPAKPPNGLWNHEISGDDSGVEDVLSVKLGAYC